MTHHSLTLCLTHVCFGLRRLERWKLGYNFPSLREKYSVILLLINEFINVVLYWLLTNFLFPHIHSNNEVKNVKFLVFLSSSRDKVNNCLRDLSLSSLFKTRWPSELVVKWFIMDYLKI